MVNAPGIFLGRKVGLKSRNVDELVGGDQCLETNHGIGMFMQEKLQNCRNGTRMLRKMFKVGSILLDKVKIHFTLGFDQSRRHVFHKECGSHLGTWFMGRLIDKRWCRGI